MTSAPAGSGLYGKTPSQGDFLRLHLPPGEAEALDGWIGAGLAELDEDAPWGEGEVAAPWRFAAAAGALCPRAVAGVLAASADRVGRRFPCLLLAPLAMDPAVVVGCTPWFDSAEALLRQATGGDLTGPALGGQVAALAPPTEHDVDELELKGRSTPFGLVMEARRAPDGRGVTLQAMLQAAPVPPGGVLWWRHDRDRTRLLVTPGAPRGEAFALLTAPTPAD